MTKRILHIIDTLERGGAQKQLAYLAKHLPSPEFENYICALTPGGTLPAELQHADVSVTVLQSDLHTGLATCRRLAQFCCDLRPDLVHTWLDKANFHGAIAAAAAESRRLVARCDCGPKWPMRRPSLFRRLVLRRADRIVVNSAHLRDWYARQGIPQDRMVVIPDGVEAPPPTSVSRRQLLTDLNLPDSARIIGAIGALDRRKGYQRLLWGTDQINFIQDGGVYLLICGDGPQLPLLRRYRSLFAVDEHAFFLGHREDAAALLPHMEVLVEGSEYASMPAAVLEAMAAGVPVIATDVPGHRELIKHGETGYLVPPDMRSAWARYLHKLLGDRQLAQRLADNARREVLRFSMQAMADCHASLYRALLG